MMVGGLKQPTPTRMTRLTEDAEEEDMAKESGLMTGYYLV